MNVLNIITLSLLAPSCWPSVDLMKRIGQVSGYHVGVTSLQGHGHSLENLWDGNVAFCPLSSAPIGCDGG